MKQITSNDQFDQLVEDFPMVLAYFSGPNCSVCASLKPKIEMLVEQQFPEVKFVEIPTENAAELSARFTVFSVPVVMFFVEQREYIREARNISVTELGNKMGKIVQLYSTD
ncbi:MAG: thioredoxin family protein [Prolixibacteraceae bacterium]|nr:thioredoxin family protein [Prolixibacteraceae bacterium]